MNNGKIANKVSLKSFWVSDDKDVVVGLSEVCKVLDEAKAEYQTIFNVKWADNETIPEINRILNFKQQEWFKKWFGATKQQ